MERKFWVKDDNGSHFDLEAFYASLTNDPMTQEEKKMLNENWSGCYDDLWNCMQKCTTREGYERINARATYAYHREEYAAGLD